MKPTRRKSIRSKSVNETKTVIVNDTICNVCYAEFLDPLELERHVYHMHLTKFNRLRFCQLCSQMFPSVVHYSEHFINDHILKLSVCSLCLRIFKSASELEEHSKKHENNTLQKMFSCSQCTMLFTKSSSLTNHEYEKHENCKEGFFLQPCYPYLSGLLKMRTDKFLDSIEKGLRLSCSKCAFKSYNPKSYIKHLKRCKDKVYVCDVCHNLYGRTKSLLMHMQSFANRPEDHIENSEENEIFRCKLCKKMFNSLTIRKHMEKCNMVLKCKKCKVSFDSVSALTAHQTKVHPTAAYLFNCKYCRQDFVGEANLKKHIDKVHKHEIHLYKYNCVHCGEIFKHPSKLFSHFQTKHSWLRPYNCKMCDKEFFMRKKFTIHIKMVHKSEGIVKFDEKFNVLFIEKPMELNTINRVLMEHDYTSRIGDDEDNQRDVRNNGIVETAPQQSVQDTIDENDTNEKIASNTGTIKNTAPEKTSEILENNEGTQEPVVSDIIEDSHFESQVETEHELQKENSSKPKRLTKRKNQKWNYSDSSEDEPLSKKAKKRKMNHRNQAPRGKMKHLTKRFTCTICKKYCFTFNNYNRHMSSHFKTESKQCIKCAKFFKTQELLEEHLKKDHSTSKLTETLRKLLENRKKGVKSCIEPLTVTERIRNTIKKVQLPPSTTKATLKSVTSDISVRKFFEDFVPDETDKTESKKVQVKLVFKDVSQKQVINMKKVDMSPRPPSNQKLAMPVKFSKPISQKVKVEVRLVHTYETNRPKLNFGTSHKDINSESTQNNIDMESQHADDMEVGHEMTYEDSQYHDDDSVPEVSQTEEIAFVSEPEKTEPQENVMSDVKSIELLKKFLPKLPDVPPGCEEKEVRVATLLPEAPYFKIVKLKDLQEEMARKEVVQSEETDQAVENINLVSVNPLAHLLGDNNLPKLYNSAYRPKIKNFKGAIAKALVNLGKPVVRNKKKKNTDPKSP